MRKRPIDVCDTVLTSDPAARSHTGGYERTDNACRDACANANPTHHSHLEPRASGLSRPGGRGQPTDYSIAGRAQRGLGSGGC